MESFCMVGFTNLPISELEREDERKEAETGEVEDGEDTEAISHRDSQRTEASTRTMDASTLAIHVPAVGRNPPPDKNSALCESLCEISSAVAASSNPTLRVSRGSAAPAVPRPFRL